MVCPWQASLRGPLGVAGIPTLGLTVGPASAGTRSAEREGALGATLYVTTGGRWRIRAHDAVEWNRGAAGPAMSHGSSR